MSAEARKERIDSFKHSAKMVEATHIAGMDKEVSLYELAQMTRAGPAKALGLASIYGGLAPGMDADVAVYNFNPEKSHKPDEIEKAFSSAAYVMKTGVPVVIDGEIVSNGNKRTIWVDTRVNENPQVMRDIRDKFLKYYSVTQGNYDVTRHFLSENPRVIEVDATR
jgi:formylmethanofuran dehydrogenase subunit A